MSHTAQRGRKGHHTGVSHPNICPLMGEHTLLTCNSSFSDQSVIRFNQIHIADALEIQLPSGCCYGNKCAEHDVTAYVHYMTHLHANESSSSPSNSDVCPPVSESTYPTDVFTLGPHVSDRSIWEGRHKKRDN